MSRKDDFWDKDDTDFKDRAVCPYCGYANPDSWEFHDSTGECANCGKEFGIEYNTTYTTYKLEGGAE